MTDFERTLLAERVRILNERPFMDRPPEVRQVILERLVEARQQNPEPAQSVLA